MNDEKTSAATRDFLNSSFFMNLFLPWIEEQKKDLADQADRLISEDAPKNKFSILSGKRQMIKAVEEQIETWKNRDKIPTK